MTRVILFLGFFSLPFLASALAFSTGKSGKNCAYAPPPPPTISYNSPVCANVGTVAPMTTNTVAGTQYFSGAGLNINTTTGVITVSASIPNTYTVTMFSPSLPPVQAVIVINALPNPSIAGASTVCLGSSVVLTANGGFNYQWSNGSTFNPLTLTPAQTTTISVSVTNAAQCTATISRVITVNPVPLVFVQSASVCAGNTVALIALATPSANVSYNWTPGNLTGSMVTVSPAQSQIYTVYANLSGCIGNTSQLVTVVPTATRNTSFSYIYPLCTNSGNPFPILSPGFATGGVYFSADGDANVNLNTGLINLAGISPGDHTISYSLAAVGCSLASLNVAVVSINQGGNLFTDAEQVTIEEGQSVELGVVGGSAYYWSPPDYLSCSDCDRPVASPVSTTKYCVSDLVDGCIINSCTEVVVVCVNNGEFAVPNAFTPNGDNNNEKFCLQGWSYCVTDFLVRIYNRWGEIVFESTDPNFCWDGIYNGKLLNSGVYVYTISASINRNPISVKKGNITLIR